MTHSEKVAAAAGWALRNLHHPVLARVAAISDSVPEALRVLPPREGALATAVTLASAGIGFAAWRATKGAPPLEGEGL